MKLRNNEKRDFNGENGEEKEKATNTKRERGRERKISKTRNPFEQGREKETRNMDRL